MCNRKIVCPLEKKRLFYHAAHILLKLKSGNFKITKLFGHLCYNGFLWAVHPQIPCNFSEFFDFSEATFKS